MVVRLDPRVTNLLHRLERCAHLLVERNLIELVEDAPVEAFADAVCLPRQRPRTRVIDVAHGKVALIVVLLHFAASTRCRARSALAAARLDASGRT